eukprot:1962613-Rhodomonas_salina.3
MMISTYLESCKGSADDCDSRFPLRNARNQPLWYHGREQPNQLHSKRSNGQDDADEDIGDIQPEPKRQSNSIDDAPSNHDQSRSGGRGRAVEF